VDLASKREVVSGTGGAWGKEGKWVIVNVVVEGWGGLKLEVETKKVSLVRVEGKIGLMVETKNGWGREKG
jgi:hypothetical protein